MVCMDEGKADLLRVEISTLHYLFSSSIFHIIKAQSGGPSLKHVKVLASEVPTLVPVEDGSYIISGSHYSFLKVTSSSM